MSTSLRHRLQTHKTPVIYAGVALIATGVLLASYGVFGLLKNDPAPTYETLLPQHTTAEDLGGWQKISPPESEPVFAYRDEIDSVAISVSQQPLPASFAGNTSGSVNQLAESYNANTILETGEVVAYLGQSARGPQSVIFAKNGLLVLIKSEQAISKEQWSVYINELAKPARN